MSTENITKKEPGSLDPGSKRPIQENQHACIGQHITLVLVTMLSRTIEDPQSSATLGIQNLQGDYLAQQSYNTTHPTLPLCFAIAICQMSLGISAFLTYSMGRQPAIKTKTFLYLLEQD